MNHKITALLFSCLFLSISSCKKQDLTVNSKEELEEKLKSEVTNNNLVSISYCIVKNDKIVHSGALGLSDKSKNTLATDNTRYLIASVSKTVTAVAIMKLVEQKLIGLDDDINLYLPFSVRNPSYLNDKITLRMLLSHTSSITDKFQETFELDCFGTDCSMSLDQYFKAVFIDKGQYFSTDNFSKSKPGTVNDYSNLASALVGYLVERASKTSFDTYCNNNIFTPLAMKKTDWRLANTPIAELAIPYSDEIKSANPHYTFPDYPNGGLRTTVLDLSKFLRMVILNGTFNNTQILSQATMTEMKTLQFGSTEQCLSFYYDALNGKKVLGHSGGEKGVTAEMYYDTNTNVGIMVFSNEEDAKLDNIMSLLLNYGEKQ